MRYQVVDPIGARVTDLSLDEVGPAEVDRLENLLAEFGVVVIPDQNVDDSGFLAFLERFGELMFTSGELPLAGYPDLNVISNVGRTTPPKSTFHVDTTYVSQPPRYTALRAVHVPTEGGHTQFSNQYAAYDTLPDEIRDDLAGRVVTHVVTGVDPGADAETSAAHPIFLDHPLSGRTALYLSAAARCAAMSGKTSEETAEIIAYLIAHSTREDNVFRHAWSAGDVVMWDNRVVMHRADHSGVVGDRVMHRGMVR
ncbi:TauD/TfdA dioxygenase family protein [Williamsia soli]|uniref:TauD/TfdA dioxygenase family protein n=1 Tax=Williamsia soli TaxID=364929 RepID=UPI001A9DA245|nr:TauD/TfdA family dioxygenase [Williamsia soli]